MQEKIRAELAKLKPGTTQCPGKLSRSLGSTLRDLRATLEKMARAGEIRFSQKGRRVEPGQFRGPFRVSGSEEISNPDSAPRRTNSESRRSKRN